MKAIKDTIQSAGWAHFSTVYLAIEMSDISEFVKLLGTIATLGLMIYSIILKRLEIKSIREKFLDDINDKNKDKNGKN